MNATEKGSQAKASRFGSPKRWLGIGFAVVAVGAAAYSVMSVRNEQRLESTIELVFYSDDEGKTYFPDSVEKTFPFDRNGKQAFRAFVYSCGETGKPFVGLLGRQAKSNADRSIDPRYRPKNALPQVEVKKPGEDRWVAFMSAEGQKLLLSVCPGGRPVAVLPGGSARK